MEASQPSFTDVEYGQRRRRPQRQEFLARMDQVIPWAAWIGLIEPHYFNKKRGLKPVPLVTMLRMYLLQVWFHLSDENVEDAINDSHAMRHFLGFGVRQVPDATTLLHFRHLLETHKLGEAMFDQLGAVFDAKGWIMRGGTVVDATVIAAPSSTTNATGTRDQEMRQTQKGNQWFFGMKAHIGVDAGAGYVHTVTATAASVHDLDQAPLLVRADDEVVYADASYQGIAKRDDVVADAHLSRVGYRISARKGKLKTVVGPDRQIEKTKASVRSKVEHPFLVLKRDFGFTKTRYRGMVKNLNRLHVAFASVNLLMRARAVAIMTG
ncbi:MAG: IS5 family transposase [Nakamurella sp.]